MFKKLLLLLTSLSAPVSLFGVTVGAGCLQHEKSGQKIVTIHDRHDGDTKRPQIPLHQNELNQFIAALSKKTQKSTFYIEYPHKAPTFKGTLDHYTVHVPIKDALAHDMHHGSIEYKTFDEHTEADYWVREILYNTQPVLEAIKNNHPMPQSFKALSIKAYLDTIQEHEKSCQGLIKLLPSELHEYANQKLALYKTITNIIEEHLKIQKLNREDHIVKLAALLSSYPLNKLMLQMHTIHSDMVLLHSVLNDKNPLIIVHGGAFHTQNLEKILAKVGFRPAFPDRNLAEGLDAHDLLNITWPGTTASSFTQPLYEFLALCNACGKESTSKCGGCKKSFYCSADCQKNDWQKHKPICKNK